MPVIEKKYLVGKRLYELYELSGRGEFVLSFKDWPPENTISKKEANVVINGLVEAKIITSERHSGDLEDPDLKIKLLQGFSEWYESLILAYRSSVNMLSGINLLKIIDVLADINDQLQLSLSRNVTIKYVPQVLKFRQLCPGADAGSIMNYKEYRKEACEFLTKLGVILKYEQDVYSDPIGWGYLNLTIDISEFDRVYSEYQKKFMEMNGETVKEEEEYIFKMTYEGMELKVNGITLTRPQADRENDLIADFLVNKGETGTQYKKDELERLTKIDGGIKKDLGKVIENLTKGTPLIRDAFFKAGKSTVRIYNPVNKERLEEMKIDPKGIEKELSNLKNRNLVAEK